MRDIILGSIALAVKTTTVYTANSVNFGASASRLADSSLHVGEQHEMKFVFQLDADLAAGDYVDGIMLQDSSNGTDWTTLVEGPALAAAAKKGVAWSGKLPTKHKQYIRGAATPQSSGTFTADTMTVWFEPGPNV